MKRLVAAVCAVVFGAVALGDTRPPPTLIKELYVSAFLGQTTPLTAADAACVAQNARCVLDVAQTLTIAAQVTLSAKHWVFRAPLTINFNSGGVGGANAIALAGEIVEGDAPTAAINCTIATNFDNCLVTGADHLLIKKILLQVSDVNRTPTASPNGHNILVVLNNDLTLEQVDLDGRMVNDGTNVAYSACGIAFPGSGTYVGLKVLKSKVHDVSYGFLNINSNTNNLSQVEVASSDFYNIYREGITFNYPNGSLAQLNIHDNTVHAPIYVSSAPTQPLAIAVASGTDVIIRHNQVVNPTGSNQIWYDCVHLEENIVGYLVDGTTCRTGGNGIHTLTNNINTGGTYYSPQLGRIVNNDIELTGTMLTGASGITASSGNTSHLDDVQTTTVLGNKINGAYATSVYWPTLLGNGSVMAQNDAIGGTVCYEITRGGAAFRDNVSENCTNDITYGLTYIGSHVFINSTTPFAGVSASSTMQISHARFEFSPVAIAPGGFQQDSLLRFFSNDRAYSLNLNAWVSDTADSLAGNTNFTIKFDGTTVTSTSNGNYASGNLTISTANSGGVYVGRRNNGSGSVTYTAGAVYEFDGMYERHGI